MGRFEIKVLVCWAAVERVLEKSKDFATAFVEKRDFVTIVVGRQELDRAAHLYLHVVAGFVGARGR